MMYSIVVLLHNSDCCCFYGFSFHQILKSKGEDEDETSGEKGGDHGGERQIVSTLFSFSEREKLN